MEHRVRQFAHAHRAEWPADFTFLQIVSIGNISASPERLIDATRGLPQEKIPRFFKLTCYGMPRALPSFMSRAHGGTQVATIDSSSVSAGQAATEFVDGRIYRDVEEMRQINAAAAAKGYLLV